MPASKKDLKKLQQKKNVAAGIGDAQGRIASNNKVGSILSSERGAWDTKFENYTITQGFWGRCSPENIFLDLFWPVVTFL